MYELRRHDLMYDLFVPLYHSALLIYLLRLECLYREAIKDMKHTANNIVNGFLLA